MNVLKLLTKNYKDHLRLNIHSYSIYNYANKNGKKYILKNLLCRLA